MRSHTAESRGPCTVVLVSLLAAIAIRAALPTTFGAVIFLLLSGLALFSGYMGYRRMRPREVPLSDLPTWFKVVKPSAALMGWAGYMLAYWGPVIPIGRRWHGPEVVGSLLFIVGFGYAIWAPSPLEAPARRAQS